MCAAPLRMCECAVSVSFCCCCRRWSVTATESVWLPKRVWAMERCVRACVCVCVYIYVYIYIYMFVWVRVREREKVEVGCSVCFLSVYAINGLNRSDRDQRVVEPSHTHTHTHTHTVTQQMCVCVLTFQRSSFTEHQEKYFKHERGHWVLSHWTHCSSFVSHLLTMTRVWIWKNKSCIKPIPLGVVSATKTIIRAISSLTFMPFWNHVMAFQPFLWAQGSRNSLDTESQLTF